MRRKAFHRGLLVASAACVLGLTTVFGSVRMRPQPRTARLPVACRTHPSTCINR